MGTDESVGGVKELSAPFSSFGQAVGALASLDPMGGIAWLFRGQACADWPLMPKAGRAPFRYDLARTLALFRHHWCFQAPAYVSSIPSNEWHRLALAQHFGLATPFLDWTTNALVALWFAVSSHEDSDGVVYVCNPVRFLHEDTPLEDRFQDDDEHWAAFIPPPVHPRLVSQSSVFTYHWRPECEFTTRKYVESAMLTETPEKIIIKKQHKESFLKQLGRLGIHEAFLFGDLFGLSNWINREGIAFGRTLKGS